MAPKDQEGDRAIRGGWRFSRSVAESPSPDAWCCGLAACRASPPFLPGGESGIPVSACLWRDITAEGYREGPAPLLVISRLITDKGMRTGDAIYMNQGSTLPGAH